MDNAASLAAIRDADLQDILQDYPCEMLVGAVPVEVHINQLALSPFAGERGLTEDGAVTAVGRTAELSAAGTLKNADRVQVKRYGEPEPRKYTVNDLAMDGTMFRATLIPQSTERKLGTLL